jgi:hypothetical protein
MTELGMDRVARRNVPEKAHSPILMTELGMDRVVRYGRPLKALSPMDVTPLGIVTDTIPFAF